MAQNKKNKVRSTYFKEFIDCNLHRVEIELKYHITRVLRYETVS